MKNTNKTIIWAIVATALGILLFIYGCIGAGDMMQYVGAFFIAVGFFSADFISSEKKKVKE